MVEELTFVNLLILAIADRVVARSLLIARFIEVVKSNVTKVILFLKRISCNFKNSISTYRLVI